MGGKLPTSLDGISVTIDGKPAPVAYVSPNQINVLVVDLSGSCIPPGTGPIALWWPGKRYVTWVGIDGYYYLPSETFFSR